MTSTTSTQQLLSEYWAGKGLMLSKGLFAHEEFLLKFYPTGQVDRDTAAFLVGVGRRDILAFCRSRNYPLDSLARYIRRNHRAELSRIKRGEQPNWPADYQRWSSDQLTFYKHLLQLEESTLTAILQGEAGVRSAA